MELVKAVNDLNDAMTMLINEIERLGAFAELFRHIIQRRLTDL